ncbi:hypothetical protein [Bacillus sp. BP-3]|uniref:hypothetical protein n=1 Tax=Bacillus sp. BP-3 TaxID=3022773 RepID=UPI00232AC477|nr:hypothetical protein [Bacillus sp. BP-3]MDC2864388.1 hypothetical protein [Bacillus sp. BP-3]
MSDFTSIARIDLVERFDFNTIDLENKYFCIKVVNINNNGCAIKNNNRFRESYNKDGGGMEL